MRGGRLVPVRTVTLLLLHDPGFCFYESGAGPADPERFLSGAAVLQPAGGGGAGGLLYLKKKVVTPSGNN